VDARRDALIRRVGLPEASAGVGWDESLGDVPVELVKVDIGKEGTKYASHNVAKKLLEFEFKEEIPRSRLRAVYGDGFNGAPLCCSSAGEAAFPSDGQQRHETASRQEEQAAGGSRRV
jgi:hypothetical protein